MAVLGAPECVPIRLPTPQATEQRSEAGRDGRPDQRCLRLYVAASATATIEVLALHDRLRGLGIEPTSTWAATRAAPWSAEERDERHAGIARADVVLVLDDDDASWLDARHAGRTGKEVIAVGPAGAAAVAVTRYDSMGAALEALRGAVDWRQRDASVALTDSDKDQALVDARSPSARPARDAAGLRKVVDGPGDDGDAS